MTYKIKALHPARYKTAEKVYGLEGKRLIGHSEKEDFYEDVNGDTYSFDGKKLKKLGGSGFIFFIDKNGKKRWRHRNTKGAIWGK